MKKNKLLCTVLPISIIGCSIPPLVTGCGSNGKDQPIATMTIDDSAVEKEKTTVVEDSKTYIMSIDYTGFAVKDGFDINNIKVEADWESTEFYGLITTKLIKVDDQHFNVKVLFSSELLPLLNKTIEFNLVFTNKLNVEQKQTVPLTAAFVYGELSITTGFNRNQYLVTKRGQLSYYCNGYFEAYKTIDEEKQKITDFSNFSVKATVGSSTSPIKANAEIVSFLDDSFGIKLSLENIEEVIQLPIILTFTNKLVPGWYQPFAFNLTISNDIAYGFNYALNTIDSTASIKGCYIHDESIEIPDEVTVGTTTYKITSIQNKAFRYLVNLRNLKINKNIKTIDFGPYSPFAGTYIEKIVVDSENETFTSKANNIECNCVMSKPTEGDPTELVLGCKGTTIPDTITEIHSYAYSGVLGVEDIVMPNSITDIGTAAFKECWNLKNVTLSNQLTTIPVDCFYGCINLEKADLQQNIETVEVDAYEGSGIKSVYFSKKITRVYPGAFRNCNKLEDIKCEYSETAQIVSKATYKGTLQECNCVYDKSDNTVLLACNNTLIPDDAKTIGSHSFHGTGLVNFTIPSQITKIADDAFYNSPYLENITFEGENNVEMGKYAFSHCEALKTVTLPSKQTNIYDFAFSNCFSLVQCKFPDTLQEIGKNAFNNCISFNLDSVPASLTKLDDSAFCSCLSLDKFIAPENSALTDFGNIVFGGCDNLKEVDLSKATQLKGIGLLDTFNACSSLEKVVLPPALTVIPPQCFLNCISLKEIVLPSTLEQLGQCAFQNCIALESVTFTDNKLEKIDTLAFGFCESLKTVTFSDNSVLTTFNFEAFKGCKSLQSIILPSTLITIGTECFAESALKTISIPASVTSIGAYAFYFSGITTATFEKTDGWKDIEGKDITLEAGASAANAKLLYTCIGWTRS